MPLEKAFAIKATPEVIWRELTGELEMADGASYSMEEARPCELLSLRVELGSGVRALVTYQLIPREDHTEVVATMEPQGFRYAVFRAITLGRGDTNYELILAQGLINLKAAAEASAG